MEESEAFPTLPACPFVTVVVPRLVIFCVYSDWDFVFASRFHYILTYIFYSNSALCKRLVRSELLFFSINTIAKVGQRVELECSTNLAIPLRWDFAEVNCTQFEIIYFNEEISR